MAVQKRNDELVDILSADFARNRPEGFWHAHRTNVPEFVTLTIPAEHQMLIYGAFTVNGALDVQGELVIL